MGVTKRWAKNQFIIFIKRSLFRYFQNILQVVRFSTTKIHAVSKIDFLHV